MSIRRFVRPGEELCKEALHYTDCGLDNIYLSNGFSVSEEDSETYTTVADLDGLHRAIGLHIVLGRKAPSGRELRFLREEMQMSQADLARMLSVSNQSVARWEKGHCDPSGSAIFALRFVYLLSLLPAKERDKLMGNLLERLNKLSEADETSDDIFLSYIGKKWTDPLAKAA